MKKADVFSYLGECTGIVAGEEDLCGEEVGKKRKLIRVKGFKW